MGFFRRVKPNDILAVARGKGLDIPQSDTVLAHCSLSMTSTRDDKPELDQQLRGPGQLYVTQHRVLLVHPSFTRVSDVKNCRAKHPGENPTIAVFTLGDLQVLANVHPWERRYASGFVAVVNAIEYASELGRRLDAEAARLMPERDGA